MNAIASSSESARVVLLGTGTPIPDPSSFGPAVAVVVEGHSYLFDAGAGVVRRAQAAADKFGLTALNSENLTRLFFTHLHSDHTIGFPDVIFTPWVMGRRDPLEVYGPIGTAAMADHLQQAYSADIAVRTQGPEGLSRRPLKIHVHEITHAGPVYSDSQVSIRAIDVSHGSWPQAFGYAINAAGRKIVLSGDTTPTDALAEASHGCDVLIHEVYSADRFGKVFANGRGQYHTASHTSTTQLAELAQASRPGLLILYHQLYFGSAEEVDLVSEIQRTYSGPVVNGTDLTVY